MHNPVAWLLRTLVDKLLKPLRADALAQSFKARTRILDMPITHFLLPSTESRTLHRQFSLFPDLCGAHTHPQHAYIAIFSRCLNPVHYITKTPEIQPSVARTRILDMPIPGQLPPSLLNPPPQLAPYYRIIL